MNRLAGAMPSPAGDRAQRLHVNRAANRPGLFSELVPSDALDADDFPRRLVDRLISPDGLCPRAAIGGRTSDRRHATGADARGLLPR